MDAPSAFSATNRKARKEHKCCECYEVIKPGQVYRYSSGVWDGRGDSFKQCLNCAEIMEAVASVDGYNEEGPCFGDLRQWFEEFECQSYTGTDLLFGEAERIGIPPERLNRLLKIKSQEDSTNE